MRSRCLVMIAMLALAAFVGSPLAAAKRVHPSKLKYAPLSAETPEIVDLELAGGLRGFLVEDHEVPVVNVMLLVRTTFPAPEKFGLNEMAQWVMRNGGSQGWSSDSLNDELEFLAAYIEVGGGNLSTMVSLNCLKRDLDRVIGIFADLVMHPLFPDDKVEMMRGRMLEEINRKNDQPNTVVVREFDKVIYGGHPYGQEKSRATVRAIVRDDLAAFHAQFFRPNNAIIGVAGDVTHDEIATKWNEAFAEWQAAPVEIPAVPDITEFRPGCYYAYKDISQAYISAGHLGINSNNPDRCAVTIMNFILGGGSFTSWITEEVREKKGLAYSAGSSFESRAWARGSFRAFAQTKSEEYSRALEIIIEQIEKMRAQGPTEEEVRNAVDFYLNGQVFNYDSKAAVVSQLLSLSFEGRPLDTPERDLEIYANLKAADISRVAREYLHPDDLTIVVVGDAAKFDRPLSAFGPVTEVDLVNE